MIYSPKQADVLLNANARWNALVGAVRSGKTFVDYDLKALRMRLLPPGNSLLVGKTQRTYERNVLDPMRERFGGRCVSRVHGDGTVSLFGRRCYLVGANDERAVDKIRGIGLVYADCDEFTTYPENFFQMLKSRLSEPGACCDLTANPEGPSHWAKKFIDETPGLKAWHFTLDDNPFLDPAFVAQLKREYTGVWYQRYILGLWVAAEGAVYSMFDTAAHVVDNLPAMRAYWVGIDYGTTAPTVFLLLGQGVDDCLYVADEWRYDSAQHSGRTRTDVQYGVAYREWIARQETPPRFVFVDPSAASFIAQLHADGVRGLAHADNEVLPGIMRVASLLSAKRLKVHKHCVGLIAELTGYVWDPKATQRGEDVPLKLNDHGPDALRYVIQGVRDVWQRWIRGN